jgi:Domain of unknown function (DUF4287)
MARNIKDRTGKSATDWVALARREGFEKHGQTVKWLKDEHKISHGYANFIALQTIKAGGDGTPEDEIATLFSGPKSNVKPIYDKLVAIVTKFGPDVKKLHPRGPTSACGATSSLRCRSPRPQTVWTSGLS